MPTKAPDDRDTLYRRDAKLFELIAERFGDPQTLSRIGDVMERAWLGGRDIRALGDLILSALEIVARDVYGTRYPSRKKELSASQVVDRNSIDMDTVKAVRAVVRRVRNPDAYNNWPPVSAEMESARDEWLRWFERQGGVEWLDSLVR